ncbi:MAG: type II methionyl aminopeptidase [Candidatus Micrarchaeia archaeon]
MVDVEKYEKAGRIAARTREIAKSIAKPGVKILDVAEEVEKAIREEGAQPAFPVNISINEIAAHYTPEFGDERTISDKDVVKIDVGAHVDGCIGDTAITLDFSGNYGKLVEASERALEAAIECIKPGVKTSEVGAIVEETVREMGFKTIENLTGHGLGEYKLHSGMEIPNIRTQHYKEIKEGDIIAIEPFATDGAGRVCDGSVVEIFEFVEQKPVRMRQSRIVQNFIKENYPKLPFAERWLRYEFKSKLLLQSALRELVAFGVVKQYPILKEAEGGIVAQAEHTIIVERDGARVLTVI